MPGKTLRAFFKKKKKVGPDITVPLGVKDTLKKIEKVPGLIELRSAFEDRMLATSASC